ncbi:MAG: hypothetical protein DI534_11905 [Leifsonia xyli]|nr:MAG: hypothetical protein DI534_11905 [Leifsonia xyli]
MKRPRPAAVPSAARAVSLRGLDGEPWPDVLVGSSLDLDGAILAASEYARAHPEIGPSRIVAPRVYTALRGAFGLTRAELEDRLRGSPPPSLELALR